MSCHGMGTAGLLLLWPILRSFGQGIGVNLLRNARLDGQVTGHIAPWFSCNMRVSGCSKVAINLPSELKMKVST